MILFSARVCESNCVWNRLTRSLFVFLTPWARRATSTWWCSRTTACLRDSADVVTLRVDLSTCWTTSAATTGCVPPDPSLHRHYRSGLSPTTRTGWVRPVENHSGARGNILAGFFWGEYFLVFLNVAFWRNLYSWALAGPKRRGGRGNLPLPSFSLSRRAWGEFTKMSWTKVKIYWILFAFKESIKRHN